MPIGQLCEVVKPINELVLRLGAVDSKSGFEWRQVAPLITMRTSINGMERQRSALIDGGVELHCTQVGSAMSAENNEFTATVQSQVRGWASCFVCGDCR